MNTSSRFRKKPVEIDAMLLGHTNATAVATWCGGQVVEQSMAETPFASQHNVAIATLEGTMTAVVGDWVIRGVQGEFYPCKPDIFAATYDPVV